MNLAAVSRQRGMMLALAVTLSTLSTIAFASEKAIVSPPLTMRAGTILNVRISQPLSSDHNRVGDTFSAMLLQPVVVNGIVVARRGQNVAGRVVEAKKAGRVSGVSRLGITLTSLTAVDGQSVRIQSQWLIHQGQASKGRDTAAVAGATGLGAAIGAAANSGAGAAIGAGVGTTASVIGVLLTRGSPTVIYPETPVTFQTTASATIETNDTPEAFRFVERADYAEAETQPPQFVVHQVPRHVAYSYPYTYYAPAVPYPYYAYCPYPYYSGPSYYGRGVSFFFGFPGYYGFPRVYGYPWSYYGRVHVPYRGVQIAHGFHSGGRH